MVNNFRIAVNSSNLKKSVLIYIAKSKTIVSDNFKLMRITATQKIAQYSVNFYPIYKSFALLVFNSCIISGKNCKAIASVVVLVGVAKIANGF